MAGEHERLLDRVLRWQSVIYNEAALPAWLRDSLINHLCQITECDYWAQPRPPLGDWAVPAGAFAMNESPRGCPQISCIPCEWYGNLPIVFFFPELARSTLCVFQAYQTEDGEVPFALGRSTCQPDLASPRYGQQVALNGMCYVDMVDRLWRRSADEGVLRQFYASAKRCTSFTIGLPPGPGGVISMPAGGGMEWFEHGEWAGMASHDAVGAAGRDRRSGPQCSLRPGGTDRPHHPGGGGHTVIYAEDLPARMAFSIHGHMMEL